MNQNSYHHRTTSSQTENKLISILNLNKKLIIIILLIVILIIPILSLLITYLIQESLKPFDSNISTTRRSTISGNLFSQVSCGLSNISQSSDGLLLLNNNNNSILNRIINGKKALKNSWSWTVSIRFLNNRVISSHICGGSLIYSQYVITVAHCVYKTTKDKLVIIAGLESFSVVKNENIYYVSDMIWHENFNQDEITNDIAVIKLVKKIDLNLVKSVICLPINLDMTDIYEKYLVTVGWGSFSGENSIKKISNDLAELVVKIYDNNKLCDKTNLNYCGIGKSTNSNTCFGDSGGPLMYWLDGKWYLYGLTSFVMTSNTNCIPSLPSYYTIVPMYLKWIGNVIATLELE